MRKFNLRASGASPTDWDEATRSELVGQIAAGALEVSAACARYGCAEELLLDWLRSFRRSQLAAFDQRLEQRLIGQGVPAAALASAELRGTLGDLSVADVVQMIELTGKSAVIRVTHDAAESSLWCAAGAIVDAESGRLHGQAAVYRVLALEHGQILAELRPTERARSVHASIPRLLLEAARRKDESVALRQRLGDERQPYQLRARLSEPTRHPSEAEVTLLALFAPACSPREALERSALGDFETLTMLCRLIAEGRLVEAPDSKAPAQMPTESLTVVARPAAIPTPPPASMRWVLNAVGTRVLLPAATWLGARLAARETERGGTPLRHF
jgi:transposase-like protein